MTFSKFGTALALGMLISFTASSATIRDDQPDSGYLNLGANPAYSAVGLFVNSWGYTGSATLIAPDWVLTAAHSLDAASSGTFTINGSSYSSTAIYRNPGWTGNSFNGYDFGLVHLSAPVSGVTPAKLYTGSAESGQTATYVGFGFTGTGLTGYQTSLGNQKRAFQNVTDGDFGNFMFGSDFDNPNSLADNSCGDATPLLLEGCVAPGDSGGGVFLTIDSETYLAGVISWVGANATDRIANADYGDFSGFGRVSSFLPWITSTAVPEPSTSVLIAGAGLALFWSRRGKNKVK